MLVRVQDRFAGVLGSSRGGGLRSQQRDVPTLKLSRTADELLRARLSPARYCQWEMLVAQAQELAQQDGYATAPFVSSDLTLKGVRKLRPTIGGQRKDSWVAMTTALGSLLPPELYKAVTAQTLSFFVPFSFEREYTLSQPWVHGVTATLAAPVLDEIFDRYLAGGCRSFNTSQLAVYTGLSEDEVYARVNLIKGLPFL